MSFPIIEPVEQAHRPRRGLRARPRSAGNFQQHCNLVYAEAAGVGLTLDVFEPAAESNGRAIVDVVSGGWHSDRVRLNEHIGLGAIDAFCAEGFTVFAVAPGSASHFTALEMVTHVHAAIRYVRAQATTWQIAPAPLGLCGVSAGGHLAALTALAPEAPDPKARQPWFQHGTEVSAVGLFFPPTDFLDYGGNLFPFERGGEFSVPRLLFADGLAGKDDAAMRDAARKISPLHQIRTAHPPFFLTHATEDVVVPYNQSTRYVGALTAAGVEATLHTHDGPGHPWSTIAETCAEMATWFKERLHAATG